MPLEPSVFPEEVQVAFFMFSLLPDYWEGMSGTYMGKQWHGLEYFFNIHQIENPKEIVYLMKIYEHELISFRAKKAEEKRKADERRAKGGGKNLAHNIQG